MMNPKRGLTDGVSCPTMEIPGRVSCVTLKDGNDFMTKCFHDTTLQF